MPIKEPGRPRATITYEQIRAGIAARQSLTEIAKKHGVSRDTVERRVKEHNKTAPVKQSVHRIALVPEQTPPAKQEPSKSLYAQAVLSERTKKADWSATQADCVIDLRKVQEDHPDSFISRNFYRVNGKYSDSTWNQHFGTFEQFKRSAGLQLGRGQHHLEIKTARHAHLDVYRSFFTSEVAPWIGKYEVKQDDGRIKVVLIGSDFHDLDADRFALSVFIDTARRLQPDVIVLNGDVYDEYEFSRYNQDPRKVNIRARYDFVREHIFKILREVCPDSQIDLIIGNHEQRILKLLADKSPAMKVLVDLMGITFSELLGLDEWRINLVCKNDFAAYNAKEMHEEVRRNYKKYYNTVIVNHFGDEDYGMSSVGGHTHKPKMMSKANEVLGPIWNLTTGSLCKIDAEYHEMKVNAQNSFVIVHVDTWERSAVPEHIMFGKKFCVVAGKYYFRVEDDEMEQAA